MAHPKKKKTTKLPPTADPAECACSKSTTCNSADLVHSQPAFSTCTVGTGPNNDTSVVYGCWSPPTFTVYAAPFPDAITTPDGDFTGWYTAPRKEPTRKQVEDLYIALLHEAANLYALSNNPDVADLISIIRDVDTSSAGSVADLADDQIARMILPVLAWVLGRLPLEK